MSSGWIGAATDDLATAGFVVAVLTATGLIRRRKRAAPTSPPSADGTSNVRVLDD